MSFQQHQWQQIPDISSRLDYAAEGSFLSNVPVPVLALALLIMHELNDHKEKNIFSRSEKSDPASMFPRFTQLVRAGLHCSDPVSVEQTEMKLQPK